MGFLDYLSPFGLQQTILSLNLNAIRLTMCDILKTSNRIGAPSTARLINWLNIG